MGGTANVNPSSQLRFDQTMKSKGISSDMINFEKMRKQLNQRNDSGNPSFNMSKIKSHTNLNDGRSKKLHTEVNSLNNSVMRSKERAVNNNSTQRMSVGMANQTL